MSFYQGYFSLHLTFLESLAHPQVVLLKVKSELPEVVPLSLNCTVVVGPPGVADATTPVNPLPSPE